MKIILGIIENNEMISLGVFANIFCTKYLTILYSKHKTLNTKYIKLFP